jgi:hypothetical protein
MSNLLILDFAVIYVAKIYIKEPKNKSKISTQKIWNPGKTKNYKKETTKKK